MAIVRYALKKFLKILFFATIFFSIIFSILQFNFVQKFLLNLVTDEDVVINFKSTTGVFPFNFSVKNLKVSNNDFEIFFNKASLKLDKNLNQFKKVEIDESKFISKLNTGLELSDFGTIATFISQKIAKNISIKTLKFADDIIKDAVFNIDETTDIRSINFLTEIGFFSSSFKVDESQIFANMGIGDNLKTQLIYGISNSHLSLNFLYKNKEIILDAIKDENSINGKITIPENDAKLSCEIKVKNGIIESDIHYDKFKTSGKFQFNVSDRSLLVNGIMCDNGIFVIEPFLMTKDLKIENIDILLKKGKINIKDIDLSDENFSLGKIDITDTYIDQFYNFENAPRGVLSGKGFYKNGIEIFDFKINKFELGTIKIPEMKILGKSSKENFNIKLMFEALKKQNIIETNISAKNWIISKESKIKMDASGDFNLEDYKISGGQIASGKFGYKVNAKGNLFEPIFSGNINLKDGVYLNPESGTYIKNGTIEANIKNNDISITKIYGTDDSRTKGTLNGSGKVILKKDSMKTEISAEFDNFEIVEIDKFDGKLFGKININGDLFKDIKVTGNLYTNNAKFDISNIIMNASRSVELANLTPLKQKKIKNYEPFIKCPLDIKFEFKPNLKITGYEIDSIWNGGAKIYGDISDPQYEGKITLTSGKIKVSNKKFDLKDGEISVNSKQNSVYNVKLSAEKSLDNIKVGAKFIQTAKGSDVKFYSNPSASKRDILSYILFDKPAYDITTGEGFTLFSIMSKLSGTGGGFDITEKIQTVLGIDTIEIKKNSNKKVGEYDAVSIGKNIGKMKISVDQGTGQDTTKVVVEANVAKNTKISVDLSGKDSVGAGIAWNKRY